MANCVRCNTQISNALNDSHSDSDEHIFPNSVGGRKKVAGFICRKCNSETGDTWDAALAATMLPLGLLFGIQRDRGKLPPLKAITTEGERITLKDDGSLAFTHPKIGKRERPDGSIEYVIKARSFDEARQKLKELKNKYPKLDVESELAKAQATEIYPAGVFRFDFHFGGPEGGRSIVKTCLAFAFANGVNWQNCEHATAYLRNPSAKACFGYFSSRDLVSERKHGVPFHCVAIWANPKTGLVLSYAEYFGILRIVACLGENYGGMPVEAAYAFDPRTGDELPIKVTLDFDRETIEDIYAYRHWDGQAVEAALSAVIGPAMQLSLIHI